MSEFFTDMSAWMKVNTAETVAKNSTNAKAGSDLEMDDFLKLMIAMFQNQSIDDTVSTSEMMNQMVQMSVIQAVNGINSMMSETTGLSYAASLVGKEVTIGVSDSSGLSQIRGTVTGTGTLNGEQVIFIGNEQYSLSSVIAVGRIPGDNGAATTVDNTKLAQERAQEKQDQYDASIGSGDAAEETESTEETEPEPVVPADGAEETETPAETPSEAYEEAAEEINDN